MNLHKGVICLDLSIPQQRANPVRVEVGLWWGKGSSGGKTLTISSTAAQGPDSWERALWAIAVLVDMEELSHEAERTQCQGLCWEKQACAQNLSGEVGSKM